jgi:RNA polymerase sigma-70 factor (ECF subfamily)
MPANKVGAARVSSSGGGLAAIESKLTADVFPDEFDRIYRAHCGFIYRTAYRMTGNSEDAEDVLQTLFARMLRRDLPPEFERNPKAYLYRAAVNIALNMIRSRRSMPIAALDDFEETSGSEDSRGQAEMRETLRMALAELSPKAAEILILRHVHGYSDAEIARLLGTSRGTIAVSLFRSRARLRRIIRAHLGDKS